MSQNDHANLLLFSKREKSMQITISDGAGPIAKVCLVGKIDIAGAEVIATPIATLAGSKRGVIVDLSGVTLISSIGIRHLVSAAKTLSRKGGKLVVVNPNDHVKDVLVTTGVDDLMPIVATDSEAHILID
jgi:anti-anti-sigma factor